MLRINEANTRSLRSSTMSHHYSQIHLCRWKWNKAYPLLLSCHHHFHLFSKINSVKCLWLVTTVFIFSFLFMIVIFRLTQTEFQPINCRHFCHCCCMRLYIYYYLFAQLMMKRKPNHLLNKIMSNMSMSNLEHLEFDLLFFPTIIIIMNWLIPVVSFIVNIVNHDLCYGLLCDRQYLIFTTWWKSIVLTLVCINVLQRIMYKGNH